MTDKAPRREWVTKLATLLGKEKAEEVITDTVAAADTLAQAGIMPKEMKMPPEDEDEKMPEGEATHMTEGEETPPATEPAQEPDKAPEETPAEDKEGDMVSEVGTKLAQQLFDAAQGNLATLTQEQVATVIADALRPAVASEETPPAPPPPSEEQQMEDTNKSITSDTTQKAIGELIQSMVSDQAAMAKSYQSLSEDAAVAKSLAPVVQQLVEKMDALEKRLGDIPRSASAASETAIDKDTEAAKAIEGAVKKSAGEQKKILGIPVKE